MARYAPATIATAHFLKANPGATARQIHEYLGSVLDISFRPWHDSVWERPINLQDVTWVQTDEGWLARRNGPKSLEGAFNHITSPYYTWHLGGEGTSWHKDFRPDWIRRKCPVKKVFIYFLTDYGTRLLSMQASKAGYQFKPGMSPISENV